MAKFKTIYRQRETLIKKDKSLPFESDQQKVNIFSKGLANYASLVPEDLKDLNKEISKWTALSLLRCLLPYPFTLHSLRPWKSSAGQEWVSG